MIKKNKKNYTKTVSKQNAENLINNKNIKENIQKQISFGNDKLNPI